jgi:hypothetical protein
LRACAEGRELAAALDVNLMNADTTHLLSSLALQSATPETAHDLIPELGGFFTDS